MIERLFSFKFCLLCISFSFYFHLGNSQGVLNTGIGIGYKGLKEKSQEHFAYENSFTESFNPNIFIGYSINESKPFTLELELNYSASKSKVHFEEGGHMGYSISNIEYSFQNLLFEIYLK